MKILEKTEGKISFAEEIDESLANAIRRSVLEIPILAIDEVEFIKNDSVLYDEVLALRLALVPLETPKDMVLKEKCSCKGKGCAKCQIQLKLSAKGPCNVYSKELKGKAKIIYPDILLAKLAEEQELELIATCNLGKGIQHTKYSPGLVYYRNVPALEVAKDFKDFEKVIKACPQKVLQEKNSKLELINKYKCDLCEACSETSKIGEEIKVKINPTKEIIFFIESWGMISAQEILLESVKALKENLKRFK